MNDHGLSDREIRAAFAWRAERGSSAGLVEQILGAARADRRRLPTGVRALTLMRERSRWIVALAALLALALVGAAIFLAGGPARHTPLLPVLTLLGDPPVIIDAETGRPIDVAAIRSLDLTGQPTLSPDGSKVAFWATNGDLVVAAIDGSNRRIVATQVSHHALGGSRIAWSPDGAELAYPALVTSADVGAGTFEALIIASVDGRRPDVRIATDFAAANAAFAPDGSGIAFGCGAQTFGDSGLHLCVARSDGSGVRVLPTLLAHSRPAIVNLSWAPDSRRIAARTESGFAAIEVGTGAQTDLGIDVDYPAWSPDGLTIVGIFVGGGGRAGLLTRVEAIRPDGTGLRTLADDIQRPSDVEDDAMPYGPAWSPDGRSIAVVTADHRLVLISLDDGTQRTLRSGVRMLLAWQLAAED